MKTFLTKEQIKKGVELAYLLYPDKQKSLKISFAALIRLENERVREKRWLRDYIKLLRDKIESSPNHKKNSFPKIHLNNYQLYQQLVMQSSDKEERQQESTKLVSQQLLIIRYLKHLVVACLDKNLLFLVVALSRVLHNYSTTETKRVCLYLHPNYTHKNLEFQIKRAKATLMKELTQRFQGLIEVVGNRFASSNLTSLATEKDLIELVNKILDQLVLWDTECVKNLSVFSDSEIKNTLLVGKQMGHVVIHPDCYTWLIDTLRLEDPNSKLEIPRFFIASNINKDDNDPFNPPDFTDDIPKLLKDLDDYKQKVKNSLPSKLAIFVDDIKRGTIELDKTNKFFLKLINEGKQLEIYDEETNLLLLSRRLVGDIFGSEETKRYVFLVANGQRFSLTIKYIPPIFDSTDEDSRENIYENINTGSFEISIACYESNPLRAIVWSYKRLAYELSSSPMRVFARLAVAAIILIILGIIAIYPNRLSPLNGNQPIIVKKSPTPKPSTKIPDNKPAPQLNDQQLPKLKQNQTPKPKPTKTHTKPSSKPTTEGTTERLVEKDPDLLAMERGGQRVTLATIKTIYVSELIEVELRKELTVALKATGRFTLIKDSEVIRNQPDATLEWSFSQPDVIILSTNHTPFIWKASVPKGSPKEQAVNILSSLMQAIQVAEKEEAEKEKNRFK